MFDLIIYDELYSEEGESSYRGLIVIDSFDEVFEVAADVWRPRDYRAHWAAQAKKLLNTTPRVAMLTWVPGAEEYGGLAWVLWREGATVYIQSHVIWRDFGGSVRDLSDPDLLLGARRTVTEDGDVISEWTVGTADIEDFVHRSERNVAQEGP